MFNNATYTEAKGSSWYALQRRNGNWVQNEGSLTPALCQHPARYLPPTRCPAATDPRSVVGYSLGAKCKSPSGRRAHGSLPLSSLQLHSAAEKIYCQCPPVSTKKGKGDFPTANRRLLITRQQASQAGLKTESFRNDDPAAEGGSEPRLAKDNC